MTMIRENTPRAGLWQAQELFDRGAHTQNIDVHEVYNKRVNNPFEGTYQLEVAAQYEYERFMNKVKDYEGMERITFHAWFNNSLQLDYKRTIKLTKYLQRMKVSQTVIDFYSEQSRYDDDMVYFTISSNPYHIAGMTYFNNGKWNSCQRFTDVRSVYLAGALHDDKLLIGFIHSAMDDVNDMANKMLARVILRVVHIDGKPHLFPSKYYGDNEGKAKLHACLKALEYKHIHSSDIRFRNNLNKETESDKMAIKESANGYATIDFVHTVEVNGSASNSLSCPHCAGARYVNVTIKDLDIMTTTVCPLCEGMGIYYKHDDTPCKKAIETVTRLSVPSYTDDYSHHGNYIKMLIHGNKLKEHLKKYPY